MITLDAVVQICGGELIGTPPISAFSAITTKLENVKHRSLLMSDDLDAMTKALELGAYGFISTVSPPADSEVAFIQVASLENAIWRLLRYLFIEKSTSVHSGDLLTALMVQTMAKKEDVAALLDFGDAEAYLQHTPDHVLLSDGVAECLGLEAGALNIENRCVAQTKNIFEVKLYMDEVYKIRFCAAFIEELQKALDFLLDNNIPFSLHKLSSLSFLEILSLNAKLEIVEDGKGVYTVLASSHEAVREKLVQYFEKNVSWGRCEAIDESEFDKIKEMIHLSKANFFVIKTSAKHSLKAFFTRKASIPTLF